MRFLNNIDLLVSNNAPDIVEKTDFGFYLGYFEKGTSEQDTENCMIIEMRADGNITTKKYAKGRNYDCSLTWSQRASYEYRFGDKNI